MSQTIKIGIDLGTCNSCIARVVENRVKIIETGCGKVTPSIVSFDPSNTRVIVGQLNETNISNCIYDAKRFIGKSFNDVQKIRNKYPFKVEDTNGKLMFKIKQKRQDVFKSPEEIGAEILKYFKECLVTDFENETEDVNIDAVITVPAYFHVLQKNATKKAAELAGINVLQLMPEPSAAAAVYCSTVPETELGLCLVFDLGGGTFDISCVDIHPNKINVKFIGGDSFLGGVNFDEEIVEYFKNKFLTERQVVLDDLQLFRLRGVAKYLKENLSTEDYSKKTVDDFLKNSSEELFELTKDKFEELNKHWFEKCINIVTHSFATNNVNKDDIKRVILVGGSTKIKRIRELLAELFGNEKIYDKLNPDESVAAGAALNAWNVGHETTFEDIDEGKVIPKETFDNFKLTEIEGDACENEIITATKVDVNNVCPMDISIGFAFNYCQVFIKKNSQVPIIKTLVSKTCYNDQTSVKIRIYEGNYKNMKANTYLGDITLPNLPKSGAGEIKITVDLSMDKNGLLNITASLKDTDNTVTQKINLDGSERNEGDNMLREWNEEKDKEFEEIALLRKMYYQLTSKLHYESVIKSLPVTYDKLMSMNMVETRKSIKIFLKKHSNIDSIFITALKEVDDIYSRNSTLEDKRQTLKTVNKLTK